MGFRFASNSYRNHSGNSTGVKMTLGIAKIIIIIIAVINLVLIAVFTMFGKQRIALALSILEAFLVASTAIVD